MYINSSEALGYNNSSSYFYPLKSAELYPHNITSLYFNFDNIYTFIIMVENPNNSLSTIKPFLD